MSSGLRITKTLVEPGQAAIQFWWLVDQLKKKKIPQKEFAARLGVSVHVLTGKGGVFPAEKVAECLELLETWEAKIIPSNGGGIKAAGHPWIGPALPTGKKL